MPVSRDNTGYLMKLVVRQPRITKKRGVRMTSKHPVDPEFEKQLSNCFYYHQLEHGPINAAFHNGRDKPEILGIKKGELDIKKFDDLLSCTACSI